MNGECRDREVYRFDRHGAAVPDLPDIPDPHLVGLLAADLQDAMATKPGQRPTTYDDALTETARELLARGWGRTA